ncbi:hypothetical protein CAFE_32570 [Caprobacter fermentans]|uniref:Uncharacterized protein n=1 Tax=Caproicibacter fermentans TaxID=2576756 RepID=A0A6N8I439_9FIRM|nr:hypothetical protein [Caproicibacter fermentans]MVB12517.1 hypothetical protein [Caproicibacter fermentans]
MKFNHQKFDWNWLVERLKFTLTDRRGGWNMPPSPPPTHTKKPSSYREVTIGKVLYRLTSVFEGSKDIDKAMERLAVQNAVNPPKKE